jgi:putative hydrolase of the HAD superfamily
MLDLDRAEGLIFDYGATIDTNGKHWFEVLWDAYVANNVPVSRLEFKEAYIYGERYMGLHPVVRPDNTFMEVLLTKTELQLKWLKEQKFLPLNFNFKNYSFVISNQCYNFVVAVLEKTRPVLKKLALRYPMVLVSNFYGNIETVLKDFGLYTCFDGLIESAVVGIRKPNPELFMLGVKALRLIPGNVAVIGDSYEKDIFPAQSIGCRTVWLKGAGEGDDTGNADAIIHDFKELERIFGVL